MTEGRFKGLCNIIGFQNIGQIEESYGKGILQTVLGGCGTKVILNPQDKASAEYFSSYLGEETLDIKQRSRSTGKSSSVTRSRQLNKRQLVEVSTLLKFPIGKAVFINPGYSSKQEAYVPVIGQIKIPKSEAAISDKCEQLWPKIREKLIARAQDNSTDPEVIDQRRQFLEEMFYLDDENAPSNSSSTGGKPKDSSLLKRLTEVL